MSPLDLAYAGYSVQLKPEGEHRTLLVLKHPSSPHNEIRILVDTARHVILKIENADQGQGQLDDDFRRLCRDRRGLVCRPHRER